APYRSELELQILPASETTALQSTADRARHAQRLLAWAGPMQEGIELDSSIVHLAPIARETPRRWSGSAAFIGLPARGLAGERAGGAGAMRRATLAPARLPERGDAVGISGPARGSPPGLFPPAPPRPARSRGPAAAGGGAGPTAASEEAAPAVANRG